MTSIRVANKFAAMLGKKIDNLLPISSHSSSYEGVSASDGVSCYMDWNFEFLIG